MLPGQRTTTEKSKLLETGWWLRNFLEGIGRKGSVCFRNSKRKKERNEI